MASLFDTNFSFSVPSSPSSTTATRPSSRSVSPCSAASPYPPPRFSVTDLASHFASQNLRTPLAQIPYEACSAYANTDGDEDGWAIPSPDEDSACEVVSLHQQARRRSYSPSRRERRQQTTRLLCTGSHRGEIAALVARMVASGEQCAVSSTSPTVGHEDEGYSSDADEMMGGTTSSSASSSRRPSMVRKSTFEGRNGACVKKNVRVRKAARK